MKDKQEMTIYCEKYFIQIVVPKKSKFSCENFKAHLIKYPEIKFLENN